MNLQRTIKAIIRAGDESGENPADFWLCERPYSLGEREKDRIR
jgi:hypothetical protein